MYRYDTGHYDVFVGWRLFKTSQTLHYVYFFDCYNKSVVSIKINKSCFILTKHYISTTLRSFFVLEKSYVNRHFAWLRQLGMLESY